MNFKVLKSRFLAGILSFGVAFGANSSVVAENADSSSNASIGTILLSMLNSSIPVSVSTLTERLDADPVWKSHSDDRGAHALHRAAEHQKPEVVQLLLDRGADVTEGNNWGATPLHYVAYGTGDVAVAQLLLDHGADVNATRTDGWTPLMCAVEESNTQLVKFLIDNGANVCLTNNHQETALHIATWLDRPKSARLILAAQHGVNCLSIPNGYGHIPLHNAAIKGYTDMVRILIEADGHATVNSRGFNSVIGLCKCGRIGKTPFDHAKYERHAETAEVLAEAGGVSIK